MQRVMCKSKLHGAKVTGAYLEYTGSITVDEALLEAADILAYERVQVVNLNNGARLETYAIPGERASRQICLNGPAARLGAVGDSIIIISYALMDDQAAHKHNPRIVLLRDNEIDRILNEAG